MAAPFGSRYDTMRAVYFHEDDYCQIELLPEANWDFCSRQMKEINTFSKEHRTDAGWTDIYVRSENPVSVSDLSITRGAVVSSLRDLLPPFDRIKTGYSTYSESCTDAVALGRNDNVVVFAEHNADDIVTKLWLTLDVYKSEDASIALRTFEILSQWPLILADWGWSVLIRIADSQTLSAYLDHRVKTFEEVARKMKAKDDS